MDSDSNLGAMLAAALVDMTEDDRQAQPGTFDDDYERQLAYRRVTTRNGDRLDEIMDEYGWPGSTLVGADAARRAWLVAQHADRQLDVQRRALRLMDQAVAQGEASAAHAAFLRDRVLVNEGRKQIYGTQIAGVRNGTPIPWPCAEPDRIDQLRAEVGIEPFAVHVAKHPIV